MAGRRALEKWAGGLSVAAGGVHGIVTPQHLQEWWGYGLFFIAAGLAQIVLGLALLTDAVNRKEAGPAYLRLRRAMYLSGIFGNLAIIGLYLVTRIVGVPAGPGAGERETVGAIDVLSKVLEVAVIGLLVALVRKPEADPVPAPPTKAA